MVRVYCSLSPEFVQVPVWDESRTEEAKMLLYSTWYTTRLVQVSVYDGTYVVYGAGQSRSQTAVSQHVHQFQLLYPVSTQKQICLSETGLFGGVKRQGLF